MMSLHWSTHQLTEYLTAVGSAAGEANAITVAVECAAETLDAEIGAVVIGGEVHGLLGVGAGALPALTDCLPGGFAVLDVPGLGLFHAMTVPLGRDLEGRMVIAREEGEFGAEEHQMLQGMGRVLGITLRSLRTLAVERDLRESNEREAQRRLDLLLALRTRERLLETLLAIQRAISHRAPLQEILDTITAGASSLLDTAFVSLVRRHPVEHDEMIVLSTHGASVLADSDCELHRAAAEAMARDGGVSRPYGQGVEPVTLLAAPVHVGGERVGAIVAEVRPNALRVDDHRGLLRAFGQQVSLALTDARTVEAMREAFHDSLTGLPNRLLFLERLEHTLTTAASSGADVTVLFLDLDGFKAVNDSLGHQAGDELLALVAGRIKDCLRENDMAARLGGDEFAVLLEGASGETEGVQVADRIVTALEQPLPLSSTDREVFVSGSVGVATGAGGSTAASIVLRNADVAMYRAKKQGPGRVVVFRPHMHDEVVERLELRADLQRALLRDEIAVQYQPLVDLETGMPTGVEAVPRWTHPCAGVIPPASFIPLAEETGVILELGRWVLQESVRAAAVWREEFPALTVSVNLPGAQLADAGLIEDVAAALRASGLPAAALTLELPETGLMRDPQAMVRVLHGLRALGVKLSIDGFGAGYSSLAYLRHFPLHQLKIDKSFLQDVQTTEGLAIVKTMVELARGLRLETVAEGIDEPGQLAALRRMGCALGQGSHLSAPLDAGDVPGFLAAPSAGMHPTVDAHDLVGDVAVVEHGQGELGDLAGR